MTILLGFKHSTNFTLQIFTHDVITLIYPPPPITKHLKSTEQINEEYE